jgi:hypothetical protein
MAAIDAERFLENAKFASETKEEVATTVKSNLE